MKRHDLILIALAVALFAAALLTIIFGGGKSRHGGYGSRIIIFPCMARVDRGLDRQSPAAAFSGRRYFLGVV